MKEREPKTSQKHESASDESESSSDESHEESAEEGVIDVPVQPASPNRTKARKDEERPKKRRKLDIDEVSLLRASSAPEEDEVVVQSEALRPRPPGIPPVVLPLFPQPRRPDGPSKSVLALQGLDKALIQAEVVNPATTLPLEASKEVQDEKTGLSARMRKRLQDVGITELFAGPSLSRQSVWCALTRQMQ